MIFIDIAFYIIYDEGTRKTVKISFIFFKEPLGTTIQGGSFYNSP